MTILVHVLYVLRTFKDTLLMAHLIPEVQEAPGGLQHMHTITYLLLALHILLCALLVLVGWKKIP